MFDRTDYKSMYGLAYVLMSAGFQSLQDELDSALAPFERGVEKDFPRDKLAFDDLTPSLRALHESTFEWRPRGSVRWKTVPPTKEAAGMTFHLDLRRLDEHFAACNLDRFEGTFAEVEPDFDAFVAKFTDDNVRDPETGLYGRWLNPLGRWDWWELGGRFNGVIVGDPRPASSEQAISSGKNIGRAALGNIARALGGAPSSAEAEIEANVELVQTLRARAGEEGKQRGPTALVLPLGCGPDEARWFDSLGWRPIPQATRELLGASEDDDFKSLVGRAYERFADHAAAGVAYHF